VSFTGSPGTRAGDLEGVEGEEGDGFGIVE